MAIEDLHIDQDSLELCLRLSIGRMAANIHDTLIPAWRAMALAGQDPRPGMARAARGLPANRAIAKGMTRADLEAEILQRRDYLRAFRDAPKGNLAQARAAVEAPAAPDPGRSGSGGAHAVGDGYAGQGKDEVRGRGLSGRSDG